MKRLIITILILVSVTVLRGQGIFCLGPKVGYNSNALTNNFDSISSSINNSLQVGAFIRLGSKVYIQPEANYQLMSGTFKQISGNTIRQQEFTVSTIKIPVLIGAKLVNLDRFNLRIFAGPSISFAINKELNPAEMGELWPVQSVDDFENSGWAVQMGGGFDVFFLTIDVRYELGVDNIYKGTTDNSMKNNVFNVCLGLKFL